MRITVSHTKSKQEVTRAVDRSFDDLFRNIGIIPIQFVEERRTWQGSTLTFSLSAKMGFVSTPIKGTIEVTDRDLTIDADLGLFERLIPATKAREAITNRVRGLLT
ncbi:MAG: polyhydroxyalkanoic acid system family protein [Acidobacteriaceae bacterium]|nr:polyhydroxyalkanoic acid system family protein [Acidobacteriaceae bacterium]